jgi:hypothetical protein
VFGNKQNCTSQSIYDKIKSDLNQDVFTFDGYYDIPIQIKLGENR